MYPLVSNIPRGGRLEMGSYLTGRENCFQQPYIPDKKRKAPLRSVHLSEKSQVIGQFSLYQCKGMSGTAASNVFCNQASKLC